MKRTRKVFTSALLVLSAFVMFSCGGGGSLDTDALCDGEILIPYQEDEDKDWGLMDINGNVIISPEFESRPSFGVNGISRIRSTKKNKYYYVKMDGDKVVESDEYENASLFKDGIAAVCEENGRVRIINENFEEVFVASNAEEVGDFNEGYAKFMDESGKWGYMDESGATVIDAKYDRARGFHNGYALVMTKKGKDKKFSFIDDDGEEVLNLKDKYEDVGYYSEGLIRVQETDDGGWGFIDIEGNKVIKPNEDWTSLTDFFNGYASFQEEDEWGLIDMEGTEVIRNKYENPLILFNDLIAFEEDEKIGFMNLEEEEIIKADYDGLAWPFICDVAIVKDNKDYIFIDETGEQVNKIELANVASYFRGLDLIMTTPWESTVESDFFDAKGLADKLVGDGKALINTKTDKQALAYLKYKTGDPELEGYRRSLRRTLFEEEYEDYDDEEEEEEGEEEEKVDPKFAYEPTVAPRNVSSVRASISFDIALNKYDYSTRGYIRNKDVKVEELSLRISLTDRGRGKADAVAKEIGKKLKAASKYKVEKEEKGKEDEESYSIILTDGKGSKITVSGSGSRVAVAVEHKSNKPTEDYYSYY